MTIVFIPYPTEVFGEALSRSQGTTTTAVFYSATMTINALAWASLWLYASAGRRLLNWDFLNRNDGFLRSCSSREVCSMRFRSASHSSTPISVWRSMLVSPSTTHSIRSHGESPSKTAHKDSRQTATLSWLFMPPFVTGRYMRFLEPQTRAVGS